MKVRYPNRAARRYMTYMTPMEMLETCCIFVFVGLKSEKYKDMTKNTDRLSTFKLKISVHKVYTVNTHFRHISVSSKNLLSGHKAEIFIPIVYFDHFDVYLK